QGSALLSPTGTDPLLFFALHGCARWRSVARSAEHVRDCEDLGRQYWMLRESVDRATLANGDRSERTRVTKVGEAVTQFIADVNPSEVSEQAALLKGLNSELGKSSINPTIAFFAGTVEEGLATWLIHHCPTELLWGIPSKQYVTALSACAALEPE